MHHLWRKRNAFLHRIAIYFFLGLLQYVFWAPTYLLQWLLFFYDLVSLLEQLYQLFALRHFSNLVSASPHPHQVLDSSINSASIVLQGVPTSLECTKCIDPIKRGNFWSSYSYIVMITHVPHFIRSFFVNVIQMWLQYILYVLRM